MSDSNDSEKTRAAKAAAAKAAATARANAFKERANNTRVLKPFSGFMSFIREQGVIGLAIGLVLGVQIKALVDQMVKSFVDPILGLVMPGAGSLEAKTFALTVGEKQAIFTYGAFLSVLISFIVVAAVIYVAFKVLKLEKLDKKKS